MTMTKVAKLFGYGKTLKPLQLKNFIGITDVKYNTWNNMPNNSFITHFYDGLEYDEKYHPKYAGMISYRPVVGQIGIFVLEDEYRNRGLGKQILQQTIKHMKENNTTHIWAVCTMKDHIFWSNVMNKSFTWHDWGKLHPSVTGCGFKMEI